MIFESLFLLKSFKDFSLPVVYKVVWQDHSKGDRVENRNYLSVGYWLSLASSASAAI